MASDFPVELPLPRSARDGDAALAARAAAGDHEAYATLVRPHERIAHRVAAAITGWNVDAQEAVQNAHVKAYRSLRTFRAGAAFRPWLLRIVINEAHNVRRAERRHEGLGARAATQHRTPAAERTSGRRAGGSGDGLACARAALGRRPSGRRAPLFRGAARRPGRCARRRVDRDVPRAARSRAPPTAGVAGGSR